MRQCLFMRPVRMSRMSAGTMPNAARTSTSDWRVEAAMVIARSSGDDGVDVVAGDERDEGVCFVAEDDFDHVDASALKLVDLVLDDRGVVSPWQECDRCGVDEELVGSEEDGGYRHQSGRSR